jgi:anti-sigma regulatory factor (Ser/Thr protein kinase)
LYADSQSIIQQEPDIVRARQRARQLAGLLGFDLQEQTRIATAVSEIARNAFTYAGGGRSRSNWKERPPPSFLVHISDQGPGITARQLF